ncbi:hypothetical protein ACIQ6Y_37585 [Streptomyces sp. NPDC096205]|uniref:hypothetical protein n=1 Tax=Streptomyces sp. NPDC096205 TaxID=3366081 RepID=UPI00382F6E16
MTAGLAAYFLSKTPDLAGHPQKLYDLLAKYSRTGTIKNNPPGTPNLAAHNGTTS